MTDLKTNIIGLDREQLKSLLIEFNLIKPSEKFRIKQIWHWLYYHGVTDIDHMTSLSIRFREGLKKFFTLQRPKLNKEQHSSDGTIKWLIKLADGNLVETVYIPEENNFVAGIQIFQRLDSFYKLRFGILGKIIRTMPTRERPNIM